MFCINQRDDYSRTRNHIIMRSLDCICMCLSRIFSTISVIIIKVYFITNRNNIYSIHTGFVYRVAAPTKENQMSSRVILRCERFHCTVLYFSSYVMQWYARLVHVCFWVFRMRIACFSDCFECPQCPVRLPMLFPMFDSPVLPLYYSHSYSTVPITVYAFAFHVLYSTVSKFRRRTALTDEHSLYFTTLLFTTYSTSARRNSIHQFWKLCSPFGESKPKIEAESTRASLLFTLLYASRRYRASVRLGFAEVEASLLCYAMIWYDISCLFTLRWLPIKCVGELICSYATCTWGFGFSYLCCTHNSLLNLLIFCVRVSNNASDQQIRYLTPWRVQSIM